MEGRLLLSVGHGHHLGRLARSLAGHAHIGASSGMGANHNRMLRAAALHSSPFHGLVAVTPAPGDQTQVHRLIETHPSGPLSPTSVIANGVTPATPQVSESPAPGDQTQVHRLIETHPSGALTPTSVIANGML